MRRNWCFVLIFLVIILVSFLVVRQIRDNFAQSDPMLHQLRDKVEPVVPALKHLRLYDGRKSYTVNKEKIYLCLRDKNGEYYPENTLVLVLLHELAHALNEEIGHGKEFMRIFEELKRRAAKEGIYDPRKKVPVDYCQY